MGLAVGDILEGKVSGITKFGAFVDLPEGKTGMVHISEVAQTYVKEISDFVKMGQVVKVKVMSISPEGKIGLFLEESRLQLQSQMAALKSREEHKAQADLAILNGKALSDLRQQALRI